MIKNNHKNSLSNVLFKNPQELIEIFCPQKYKNYYIRGQITEFSDNIYDNSAEEGYFYAYYHLKVFCLINDNYLEKYSNNHSSSLGIFIGKNVNEFVREQKRRDLMFSEGISKCLHKSLEEIANKEIHNPPLTINISDIDFENNDYLKTSFESKKDIILLSMNLSLAKVVSSKSKQVITGYPVKIHQLTAYHLSSCGQYSEDEIASWFWDLYNSIYFNFN